MQSWGIIQAVTGSAAEDPLGPLSVHASPRADTGQDKFGDGSAVLEQLLGHGSRTACMDLLVGTDWSATAAGPAHTWPAALHSAVGSAMASKFPMLVMAGDDLTMIYNDGYAQMLGHRHPAAMGQPLAQVWSDVWPTIAPMIETVIGEQQGNYFEDLELVMHRNGFDEQTYFTFSYSPLIDTDGTVVGVLDTALETTGRVLANRRMDLAQRVAHTAGIEHQGLAATCEALLAELADHPDVTRAGIVLLDRGGPEAPASFGIPPAAIPRVVGYLRGLESDLTTVSDLPAVWPSPTDEPGVARTLALPLAPTGTSRPIGALMVRTHPQLPLDSTYTTTLRLLATQVATAVGNATDQATRRQHAAADRRMSVALQRSLLTDPVQPDHLQLVTRYVPAAVEAEVGGDWYDAFLCQDGSTLLVAGDVAGHDQAAAAVMGQVRNLLRGIAYTQQESPALVLAALDRAMAGLGVISLVSVVAMRIEQTDSDAAVGLRRVRWSNAGHPPPVLTTAGGRTRLLRTRPEMMLGARPDSTRTDHQLTLQPGDGLLMYTDGLIERRGRDLDIGEAWLVDTVSSHTGLPLQDLCDHLLAEVETAAEDDIAILAVRAHSEDEPRPAEAGPQQIPLSQLG